MGNTGEQTNMARPKKQPTDQRRERVTLRLRVDERVALSARAVAAGLTLSEFARVSALQACNLDVAPTTFNAAAAPQTVDPQLVLALNRVGVNLNQIARALNNNGGFDPVDLSDALSRLNSYLDQVVS